MSQPDAVVFDLGKVLVDFDYSIAARRIAGRGTAEPDAVQGFLDHSPLLYRYETGHIGRQEFFEAVRRFSGFKGGIDEFAQFFADIFTEIPPMIALQRRLRTQPVAADVRRRTPTPVVFFRLLTSAATALGLVVTRKLFAAPRRRPRRR